MKFSELHRIVNLYHRDDHYEDPEVVIMIKLPYATVGAHPTVPVKNTERPAASRSVAIQVTATRHLKPQRPRARHLRRLCCAKHCGSSSG